MDGILLVDKPQGWTSHDVVAKVRSVLKQSGVNKPKVGHTGTLDPLATGLLVLVVGSYTKRAQEFTKLDKTYEVTMKLGATSTTGDSEGTISSYSTLSRKIRTAITEAEVKKVLRSFVGEIDQVPPVFSAIKVGGQRAYKLARAGKEVKLESRKVKIYEITGVEYAYPEVKFTAKVSSGTYIRSLVEDIGKKLGAGAYMTALRRTEVGGWGINDAQRVESANIKALLPRLL